MFTSFSNCLLYVRHVYRIGFCIKAQQHLAVPLLPSPLSRAPADSRQQNTVASALARERKGRAATASPGEVGIRVEGQLADIEKQIVARPSETSGSLELPNLPESNLPDSRCRAHPVSTRFASFCAPNEYR